MEWRDRENRQTGLRHGEIFGNSKVGDIFAVKVVGMLIIAVGVRRRL